MRRVVMLMVLLVAALLVAERASAAGRAARGLPPRVSWDVSRVVGTPDPPDPYRGVRVFPKLNFAHPLYMSAEPGSDRLLVVEQNGRVRAFAKDKEASATTLFCEIADADTYGMAFHPRYAENHLVYIFANGPNSKEKKKNRILRYEVATEGERACRRESEKLIIEWDSNGHNGGDLAFGPDGMLYITSGDGTTDSDGDVTGQKLSDLNSGVLRIDVEHPAAGAQYAVPKDNPFVQLADARPELWCYGMRNPWRIAVDRETGRMWVGDIGQDQWEMIQLVQRGANYGWSVFEGSHPFYSQRQLGPHPVTHPIVEHPHSEARSITGGLVYYGPRYPELRGTYLYGDFSTGKVWGLRYDGHQVTWHKELADTPLQILGFATDPAGEIYLVDYLGGIYALEPNPPREHAPPFPHRLSETGVFESTANNKPHPALLPYSVNAPLWSDGAAKERFIAIPGLGKIDFTEQGAWHFPEGTVLVKTFSLPSAEHGGELQRIETRLLKFEQGEWEGYSYRWNDDQTDAELVAAAGEDVPYSVPNAKSSEAKSADSKAQQTWHFPSRAECMMCHTRAAGFVLGLNTLQMNREHPYALGPDNQLSALARVGAFKDAPTKDPGELAHLVDPAAPSADLTSRARSYLHANCAICHIPAGGGNSAFDVAWNTTAENIKLIGLPALHDKFGLEQPALVVPGHPERSVLYYRMTHRGAGQMPPLATHRVDDDAVQLMGDWIKSLAPLKTAAVESAEAAAKNMPEAKTPPAYACRWTAKPPKIDGHGDDPAWKDAAPIDNFAVPWEHRAARSKTSAKLLWNADAVYILATVQDDDLFADITEHDGMTWSNDVFEMFFKPRESEPGYYEFQVTPHNTTLDIFFPARENEGYKRWRSAHEFHWKTAVELDGTLDKRDDQDRSWTAEARIPWSDFRHTGGAPKVGDVWRFNLCRYDFAAKRKAPELSTNSPLTTGSFHRYEDFSSIRFEPPPAASR